MSDTIRLRAGNYYRLRNGSIVGPVVYHSNLARHPYECQTPQGFMNWSSDGRYSRFGDHQLDIVSEVPSSTVSPAPSGLFMNPVEVADFLNTRPKPSTRDNPFGL